MRPLVILRPEPGASRTAEKARALGLQVRTIPLFELGPVDWAAPDPTQFDGLVLTSANAVRHGGPQLDRLKALPVHAVGGGTAESARAAGFKIASVGHGGARQMRLPAGQRLLHLAGGDHIRTGAAATVIVYEARPIDAPAGLDRLESCVVAVHSPRAGRRLAELVADRSQIAVAAISRAAAEACGMGWEFVAAAPEPRGAALLALAARLCKSSGP